MVFFATGRDHEPMCKNKRIICPSYDELGKLRQPPTDGELKVLDFFDRYLPPKWEIYMQPHLNGLKPDFVLLNPEIGIGIFEIKDWKLDMYSYFEKDGELWGKQDGKEFWYEYANPIPKLRHYKEELFNLYCPRLGLSVGDTRAAWAVITIGTIFPFSPVKRVKDLFEKFLTDSQKGKNIIYNPISGMEDIESGNLENVFPEAFSRKYSQIAKEELFADLRGWLVEGEFTREQRERPLLSEEQKNWFFPSTALNTEKSKVALVQERL